MFGFFLIFFLLELCDSHTYLEEKKETEPRYAQMLNSNARPNESHLQFKYCGDNIENVQPTSKCSL